LYKNIFITATNTDIGKTYSTIKLIKELSNKGYKVGVIKPIETGVTNTPLDGTILYDTVCKYNSEFKKLSIDDIVPYQFRLPAAPYVAKDIEIDLSYIKSKVEYLHNFCDILLIEGAGGLLVPIELDFFIIDLIEYLDAKAILITSSKLGSINDTLLSIEKLKSKNIDFYWSINLYKDKDDFYKITYPYYKDKYNEVNILQSDIDNIVKYIES
jgi:dethiobiotin synthetase